MSYESDPSGQPLPGDSDSFNLEGQTPQEGQNSWLLDGEQTPLESQPLQPEPADFPKGESWLLDGEEADEPSLVITEDSEGDSWLMNVDEPTVALEEEEAVEEHGFSASYCEPESTASTFSRLLVPAVFVGALSVGGMLVWRSMSGLGTGTDDSNTGVVVNDSDFADHGEQLSGPSFEVPGTTQSSGGSTLRGSIQRDGSVKQAAPGFTANVAKGQFGFTPSSKNASSLVADAELEETVDSALDSATEGQVAVASDATPVEVVAELQESEVVEPGASLEEGTLPTLVNTVEPTELAIADHDESTVEESEPFGLSYFTAQFEVCMSPIADLYRIQPSEGRILSFEPTAQDACPELPLWGPGTPVEPAIAMEFEDFDPNQEPSEPQVTTETLLSNEQDSLLAQAEADDSVELAFLFEEQSVSPEPVAVALEPLEPEEPVGLSASTVLEESTGSIEETFVEEQSTALAAAEEIAEEEAGGAPLGRRFIDELLAMGPITGFEDVPAGADGFELSPMEEWLEEGTEVAPELLSPTLEENSELASVASDIPEGLPVSLGFDGQGDWLVGDEDQPSEVPTLVAVQNTGSEEQAIQELFSVPVVEPTTQPSEGDPAALASVDEPVVKYSVPADPQEETMSSIDPMFLGNPFFELEEIGMVPVQGPVVFNWEDPLADVQTGNLESELATTSEQVDGLDEILLSDPQVPVAQEDLVEDTGLELVGPLLVDTLEFNETTEFEGDAAEEELIADAEDVMEDVTEDVATLVSEEADPAPLAQVTEESPVDDQDAPAETPSEMPTEFGTDGMPTVLVAPETETPTSEGAESLQAAATEELFSVPSEGEVASGAEPVAPIAVAESDTSEGNGERSLLDMYSDWNQAEDEGTLQSLSSSKWLNFSIGDGEAMPFRMAQASIVGQREELAGQPVEVKVEAEVKKPQLGVLKKRQTDTSHWQGKDVPMHALSRNTVLLTPNVGPVRVIAVDGETLEGRLHGIGQNYVWLVTNLGRLSIPSRRVERVEPIDPAQFDTKVKSTRDYTKLPRVRVKMKGGVFIGHELAREGNRITIRTDKGHKLTLVSNDIQPARPRRAKSGIKRRIE